MSIFNLFSKRQKVLRGDVPDVYTYNEIPHALKIQIVHIWTDSLCRPEEHPHDRNVHKVYMDMVNILCREYGLFLLPNVSQYDNHFKQLSDYFLNETDIEKIIDVIELTFQAIDTVTRDYNYCSRYNCSEIADSAISDLNTRFKEHGIGYQYINKSIIRVDSEFVHAEIIKPALQLLQSKEYKGAQEEYLKAHEHYRHGNAKEALNECLKTFESVMKAICDKKGWKYSSGATSKTLIQICFEKELIPIFWQDHYSSLRNILESSVPTGRNKLGGHGQGTKPIIVPDYLVAYMLNMTASAVVFLVEAESKI